MGQLNLKNFYKYYIKLFLQNRQIKHLIYKILNDDIFKNNLVLKKTFLKLFFFKHPYFQSKLLVYYKRKIWGILMTKNLSNLEKMELWHISQNYLKFYISNYLNNNFFFKSNFFDFFKKPLEQLKLKQLISDLNKILLFKSLIEKKSIIQSVNDYRFNNQFSNTILRTTLGFFSKKRLRLFNLNYEFNKNLKPQNRNKNTNELNKLLQIKIAEFRHNMYRTTGFLLIKLKLNNIFLTVLDYQGNTIYQCSGGFYGIKGQTRINTNTIKVLAQQTGLELKRIHNIDKLVILYKTGFTNKLIKSTIQGLNFTEISLLGTIYGYNRPTTILRKRKTRRV